MRDLTSTAAGNSAQRRAAAAAVIAGDASGRLGDFRRLVAGSALSTNVFASKVQVYDRAGGILDTRQFEIVSADGDRAEGLRRFATRQADWLPRREGFEDLWQHGRELMYGAVNAGGMGTEDFGPICLVIGQPDNPPPDALATFPADSAQRYTTDGGAVDETSAVAEATAWNDRAELAVIERAPEVRANGPDHWPIAVCTSERYFEVARAGALPTSSVSEVRLRADYQRRLRRLRARALAGDTLTGTEANEAATYDVIRRWRRSHGTELTVV